MTGEKLVETILFLKNDAKSDAEYKELLIQRFQKKIYSCWGACDIMDYAHQRGYKCSEEKAVEILATLDRDFDASIGINWDVIEEHLI